VFTGAADKQDLSPPRKRSRAGTTDPADALPRPGPSGSQKPRFMPDGSRAGQVSGSELAAELKAKAQREAKQFAALGTQLTGRGADTVRAELDNTLGHTFRNRQCSWACVVILAFPFRCIPGASCHHGLKLYRCTKPFPLSAFKCQNM